MKNNTVDQSRISGWCKRQPGKAGLAVLGVAVLLSGVLWYGVLASAALDHLMPKMPNHAQGLTDRVEWYLHSGQWQADVLTLAATFWFVMASDCDTPANTNWMGPQVAENEAAGDSKS